MTRIMIILFVLFISNIFCLAQLPKDIGELKRLLAEEYDDSVKSEILNELAWQLKGDSPQEAKSYAIQALDISLGKDLKINESTSLYRIGIIEKSLGNSIEAIAYFDRSLFIEKSIERPYGIGRALGQLTELKTLIGQHDQAILDGRKSISAFQSSGHSRSEARARQRLAKAHYAKGDYDAALSNNEQVVIMAKNLGDDTLLATSESLIGEIYTMLGLYRKSLLHHENSLRLWEEKEDSLEMAKTFLNLGIVYGHLDSLETAERFINKSTQFKQSVKKGNLDKNYNNLAIIKEKDGQLDEALNLYEKSLKLKLKSADNQSIAVGYFNLGLMYSKLDEPEPALENLELALPYATKSGYPRLLMRLYWALVELYEDKDSPEVFTKYLNLYKEVREQNDAIFGETLALADKYEDEKVNRIILQQQNDLNEAQILNQKTIIYSLLTIITLMAISFFFAFRLFRLRKANELIAKNREIETQRAEINERRVKELLQQHELSTISAMIEGQEKERGRIARDLHDRIGGILSMVKLHFKSVEDEIKKAGHKNIEKYTKANNLLDEACDEVRKVAQDLTVGVLPNFGLVAALNDLKSKLESSGKLQVEVVSIGLDQRLAYNYEINIYRIIQELISNILKHAKATEIEIQVFKKNGNINIMVVDNGIGFDPQKIKASRGMGLDNINKRIAQFEGEMGIDSKVGAGTTVTIDIVQKNEA